MIQDKQHILHTVIFFCIGLTMSIVGVLVYAYEPYIQQQILPARFIGAMIGALAIGFSSVRYCFLKHVHILMILTFLSLYGISANILIIVSHFILGFSTTGLIILFSQTALKHEKQHPSSLIIITQQCMFGMGAIITPLILASPISDSIFAYTGALSILFFCVWIWKVWRLRPVILTPHTQQNEKLSLLKIGVVFLPLYITMFMYAGIENGLNIWLYTWLNTAFNTLFEAEHTSLLIVSVFWMCLTCGRLSMIIILKIYPTLDKVKVGIGAIFTGILCLIALSVFPNQYIFVLLLAMSLGPMYPAFLSLFSRKYPLQGLGMSLMTFASALGSMTLATALGTFVRNSTSANTLPLALLAILIGIAVLCVGYFFTTKDKV